MSVSLDGNNIQLSFQKDEQSTSVVLDHEAARSLVNALGQLLDVIEEQDGEADEDEDILDLDDDAHQDDLIDTSEMVDITSPTIDIGLDDQGHAVLTFQAGAFPRMLVRLQDEEARYIARGLLEVLNSPQDIRQSGGGH